MPQVKLENVWKKYGDVEAVKDLNIECRDREFLCLLGPSGCGKSSTLRMIAGLEAITEGTIYIDDVAVNEIDPYRRDIAMVFENYALYPHKKVYENLAYPLRVQKKSEAEIDQRVKRAAEILEITPLLDRWPRQLSGGQKQRVAIGRAIVRNPRVFLLDEPISHLDAKLRTHMRSELKRLHRDLDATMIYVTHDQLEAMTMADRIAVLNYGVLQQLGTPDEVFNHPKNKFVAGFLGDPPINFLPCRLHKNEAGWQVVHEHFRLQLPELVMKKFVRKDLRDDMPVDLGLRPESFEVSNTQVPGTEITGKIYVTEPLGEDLLIDISIGKEKVKARTVIGGNWQIDEPIWMKVRYDRVHLFDSTTEETLLA